MLINIKTKSEIVKLFLSSVFIVSFLLTVSILVGCQNKSNKPENASSQSSAGNNKESKLPDSISTKNENSGPNLIGTWTGKFEQRAAYLNITDQSGNEFHASIKINYRQPINQKISGKIDPKTLKVTMQDLLHSRYQGNYIAKLSSDYKELSGTFTKNLDHKSFSFDFTKK